MTTAPWAMPMVWTADELLRLSDAGLRCELIEGRIYRTAPTSGEHGRVTSRLHSALGRYVEDHGLGELYTAETGFDLTQPGDPGDTVLAPDLAFMAAGRLPPAGVAGYVRLAPDLVVETASLSQTHAALSDKARLWRGRGVRLVWVVWPRQRQIEVWSGDHSATPRIVGIGDTLSGNDVVPGFSRPISDVFP